MSNLILASIMQHDTDYTDYIILMYVHVSVEIKLFRFTLFEFESYWDNIDL